MSAIRDTILNNYLAAYAPSVTRYDTHKKSELRSTYNSIVKLNKESPWYLPVTSGASQTFAIGLKESARELHNSIAELGGLDDAGLVGKKSAYSSNEDIAKAIYIGEDNQSDDVPGFEIEVKHLASGQVNEGDYLPFREVALPEDTYSFDTSINDMNYEFQFSIHEGETNEDVQNRLARLINNANIGLKASVLNDGMRSALQISSESSGLVRGKEQIFSISDDHSSKTSGAVDYFGLNKIATPAQNAEFTINGEERTASSNHFTVGRLYDISLTGENGTSTIGLKTDTESVTDNVSALIGSFNDFLRSVNSYLDQQTRSKQLLGEMNSITSVYSSSLAELGITSDENGTLTVDRDKLKEVAENSEDLSSTFDALKDFSGSLLRKSTQVSMDPMNYVKRTIVAYKNPGHNFATPYTTSDYTGMMFNFYC